jgi:hypothetical protein
MLAGKLAQREPGSSDAFSAMSSRAGACRRARFLEEALALEAGPGGSSCQNTRRAGSEEGAEVAARGELQREEAGSSEVPSAEEESMLPSERERGLW